MIILADEGIDKPIVDQLRAGGLSVIYIIEGNAGVSDDKVLELANKNSAILSTADKDFGELVYRQKRVSHGVILVRLPGLSAEAKTKIVVSAFNDHSAELENAFTVISPDTVRIRHSE